MCIAFCLFNFATYFTRLRQTQIGYGANDLFMARVVQLDYDHYLIVIDDAVPDDLIVMDDSVYLRWMT